MKDSIFIFCCLIYSNIPVVQASTGCLVYKHSTDQHFIHPTDSLSLHFVFVPLYRTDSGISLALGHPVSHWNPIIVILELGLADYSASSHRR